MIDFKEGRLSQGVRTATVNRDLAVLRRMMKLAERKMFVSDSPFRDVEHHGPEAFFRHMIGVKGRKKQRKKDIFYQRTAGMPPLTVVAQQPGQECTVLWQMDGISEGRQMKQLVFPG